MSNKSWNYKPEWGKPVRRALEDDWKRIQQDWKRITGEQEEDEDE